MSTPFAAGRFGQQRAPVAPEPPAPAAPSTDAHDEPASRDDHSQLNLDTDAERADAAAASQQTDDRSVAPPQRDSSADLDEHPAPAVTEHTAEQRPDAPKGNAKADKPRRGRGRPKTKDDGSMKILVVLDKGKVITNATNVVLLDLDEARESSCDPVELLHLLAELKQVRPTNSAPPR